MTLPRSSGCTRTSRRLPRRSDLLATWTSSGYWTMPRTRCSRASSSTSGSTPRLAGRWLGAHARRGVALSGVALGGVALSGVALSGVALGVVLGGALGRGIALGGVALGGGGVALGRGIPGGPRGPAPGLTGSLGRLFFLGGQALLGGGREALLLILTRR